MCCHVSARRDLLQSVLTELNVVFKKCVRVFGGSNGSYKWKKLYVRGKGETYLVINEDRMSLLDAIAV